MATKSKTKEQYKDKADDALENELAEKQKHLFDLRSQAVTEKLEDPSQLGKTRREIARIKTILRGREIEEAGKSKDAGESKTIGKSQEAGKSKAAGKSKQAKKSATKS
ncbi:MAG: 50S ribosomal protein L29 [Chthoniobacterales bacterium]|nr:50S ribosomal protein L29 [Chthoniobacterales bacterium]